MSNNREKCLILHGQFKDLRDVLKIAIVEGKKVLRVNDANKVKVKPVVYQYGENAVLVIVGCDGASVVGSGKTKKIGED